MSGWKLVEAEATAEPGAQVSNNNEHHHQQQQRGHNSNSNGGRWGQGGNRNRRYKNNSNDDGLLVPNNVQNRKYYADMARQQIELLLAPENLYMDVNLRSNMDEAGYLPIAYLCNYENVAYFGALYCDIIDALANSSSLEIDQQNEVVRVTDNWKMWLVPNAETGGLGVARYIIHQQNTAVEGKSSASDALDSTPPASS